GDGYDAGLEAKRGSSGGSVQALKKVDMLAQSNVASSTPFRLETQHVHQLVVPCVRDSGIHLHSDSLRWRNHPLCHRPGEKTVVLLGLRLVGSTPTWSRASRGQALFPRGLRGVKPCFRFKVDGPATTNRLRGATQASRGRGLFPVAPRHNVVDRAGKLDLQGSSHAHSLVVRFTN